ncbi:hypothetical protein ACFRMO_08155 [Streptomyces anulatus]|uniref:hypothetical protein n=1 Tax=Streptomyces anulatus TaxID=1892 RepID=UPI003677C2A7
MTRPDAPESPAMTVFTVEVFDTFTAETIGFYSIVVPSIEYVEGSATQLTTAMNYGRSTALDWRQIAEHAYEPYEPFPPNRPATGEYKATTVGVKIGATA